LGETVTITAGAATAPDLDDTDLDALDAGWRAANYLAVGQFYLVDNPLLHAPLTHTVFAFHGYPLRQHLLDERRRYRAHTRATGEDAPDVRDWCWPA
jgi:phosphoketolase